MGNLLYTSSLEKKSDHIPLLPRDCLSSSDIKMASAAKFLMVIGALAAAVEPSPAAPSPVQQMGLRATDDSCATCIALVNDLDSWLTEDKTDQEIAAQVDEVCKAMGYISPDYVKECVSWADKLDKESIADKKMEPKDICNMDVKICP